MAKILSGIVICGLILASVSSFAEVVDVKCRVFGKSVVTGDYQNIVQGFIQIDASKIIKKPLNGDGCYPISVLSPIFGTAPGTRIQISVNKCRSDEVYLTFRVTLNGVPVIGHMDKQYGRIVFNEDQSEVSENTTTLDEHGLAPLDTPITTPEGTFQFIYADCKRKI